MRKFIHFLLGMSLLGPISTPSIASDPARALGSWRPLTAEEEHLRTSGTPPDSIDHSTIEADFNGHGIADHAELAIRTTDQVRGLIAIVDGRLYEIVNEAKVISDRDGLRVAKPGSWDPVCGNALSQFHACDAGEPQQVDLRTPGIFLISGGSTILYHWNPQRKSFDSVVMVD